MIEFAWPWIFAALPLPILAWRMLPEIQQRQGAALKIPFLGDITQYRGTQQQQSNRQRLIQFGKFLVWLCLLFAAARPQWLGDPIEFPISGRDLMLAVDISGSMQTRDLDSGQSNRLEIVKKVLSEFIERRKGDRVGLILFGKRAYMQTPLTFDLKTVSHMLSEAEIGLAGNKTAIGDAIGIALKRYQEYSNKQKILILLTDGQNTAGALDPRQAAKLAQVEDLRIYTLGIGADRIQTFSLLGPRYRRSDLDEKLLRNIAQRTGGIYFRAKDTATLAKFYRELDRLEPLGSDTEILRPVSSLFYWPLAIAFLLSLIMVSGLLLQSKLVLR